MRKFMPVLAAMLCMGPLAGHAQNAAPSAPLVRLPVPDVPQDAPPSAFVAAARSAIAAGRPGEAMEAIERAESRLLVRSVRPSRAWVPSDQALVRMLADARAALGQGDRATALARLAEAQANPALDAAEE
jgi:hypothetical protein